MSNVEISKTCYSCGKVSVVKVKREQLSKYNSGALVQEAFPDLDRVQREVLISGMCPRCQSKTFHFPLEGDDWGTKHGTCPCCDAPIYDIDKTKDNTFMCSSCYSVYPCVGGKPDFENEIEFEE